MTFLKKLFPLFLILAVVGDFSLPYYLGRFYPGFDQATMIISQLGEATSPVQTYFNRGSIVTGTLFVLSSFWRIQFFSVRIKTFSKNLGGGHCTLWFWRLHSHWVSKNQRFGQFL
ncbi:membrane protein [Enterococcus malodoratus]|uniref:DUF998 domain-containing protein n=1 Tax=Enterococcus malodoratus ATCC 43197 TaxID=1158601 RepID=R2NZD6_9ENTE|nr:hypothetical protein UAI_02024 [Enterococcus malodoratus ATCC 43197]EOT64199.1 hypothetical protein I585_03396 [Enterococcus malodoratus ATCC 43197]SPX00778.1 membrane protein [Enterococcus malodoratus]STD66255.1 membrane protein [Enterococcus malodoratus]